jgi:FMN phosphatase YigB (HAD superfamily)
MEYALVSDHWAEIVRYLKDKSKSSHTTELCAIDILRYIRRKNERGIKQPALFRQRRGEEYEKMLEFLVTEKKYELAMITNILDEDDFWEVTLEMTSY